MAEQAYILDIDTKFLDNVQKIDQYLANAAKTAYDFTEKFKDLANSSGAFAGRMKALEEEVAKIGKLKVNDLGLATISVDAKEAIDNTNILAQRMAALKEEWLAVTSNNRKGSGLIKAKDLTDISKLQSAIEQLKEKLNTEHVSSAKQRIYVAELELYQKMVKEMMKSNKTLSDEEAKRLQKEYNEILKYVNKVLKLKEQTERKKRQDEAKDISDIRKEYTQLLNVQKQLASLENQMSKHQSKYGKDVTMEGDRAEVVARLSQVNARQAEMEREYQKELSDLVEKGEIQRTKILTDYQITRDQITANDHNKIRADFQKLLHDQVKLSEAYHKAEMLRINGQSNGDLSNRIASREAAVNKQIQDMEMKHQDVLTDLMVQAEDQRTNIAVNKAKHRAIEANAAERAQREREAKINSTPTGAMAFSQGADSITERKQAIKYLEKARDELKQSEMSASSYKSEVKKLNDEIKRQQGEIDKLIDRQRALRNNQDELINAAKTVSKALAAVFSIEAIRRYINQVRSVRGEFEMQHRSLQVLLRDKEEANVLWGQVVDLAVKSPFQVKELVTYTKQMAAYRIESDKLFDTTKMLADVSAGLGVDMSRLILAFGQVRAAEFLRGTELRQFTEAGVPMLEELAKHFSELEDRIVTTGDVFERITKRMVSFKDVEAVFQKITSQGGLFYKMQEKQAETLKGMTSNLRDQIDLMFNEIGKQNESVMKKSISILSVLIKNWRIIESLILGVTVAYVSFNAVLAANIVRLKGLSMAAADAMVKGGGLLGVIGKLTKSLKALGVTMANNPLSALLVIVSALGVAAWRYFATQQKLNEAYEEQVKQLTSLNIETNAYADGIIKLTKRENELRETLSKLQKDSKDYKDVSEELTTIEAEKKNLYSQLYEIAPKFAEQLEAQKNKTQELTRVAKEYNDELRARLAIESILKGTSEAIEDYTKTQAKAQSALGIIEANKALNLQMAQTASQIPGLRDDVKKALEEFIDGTEPYYQRLLKLAEHPIDLSSIINFSGVRRYRRKTKDVDEYIDSIMSDVKDAASAYKSSDAGVSMFGMLASNEATEEEKARAQKTVVSAMEDMLDRLKIPQDLRDKARKKIEEVFGIELKLPDPPLDSWAVRVRAAVSALNEKIKTSKTGVLERDLFPLPEAGQTKEAYLNIAKSVLSIAKATYQEGQALEDEAAIRRTNILKDFAKEFERILNIDDKKTSGGEEKLLSKRIDLLKEVNEEYEKLRDYQTATEATSHVIGSYKDTFADAFKGMSLEDITALDFTTLTGLIDMLKQLKPLAEKEGREAEIALSKAISGVEVTLDVELDKAANERFRNNIDDMFAGYELTVELEKLNVPKDLARDLFSLEATDLSEIREMLEAEKKQEGLEKERLKIIEESLRRIDELEDKAQQERLKKYVKYLVAGQGERVKIKLDEMRQIAEIESLPFDDAQKELAREAVRAEANKRIEKLDWEEFKDSGMYVRLFEDLEFASSRTLKLMREKLIELKSQLSDLDADDLKHLYDQIEKLDNELVERNPFKSLAENADEYFKSLKRLKNAEAELAASQEKERILNESVSSVDAELSKEKGIYEQMSKSGKATAKDLDLQRAKAGALNSQLLYLKAQLLAQGKLTKELEEQIDAMVAGKRAFTGSAEEIGTLISEAANAIPQVAGHLENVFGTMSDGTRDTLDSIATIGGGIGDAIAGFASNNPVQAIMGIAQAIGGIFAAGDKAKERMIQRELKHVKELDKRYQEIDEALDNMYNARQMADYTKELSDNIDAQIADYERMRALEADKKKSDQEKMDEYNQAIEDLNKRREEMFAEQQSKATGGILDDAISAAEGFVDAWYDAFQETGDGLSGLESNFKEMLTNLIKKQAAMQIVGNFTKQYSDWLKDYINVEAGDPELTAEEARLWAERVKATLPELSNMLENFFSGTQDLLQEQGELSELSKGIQGVTESTAQVLEALLNSMRFYVADSNVQLKNIANALISNDVEANPLLNELRQQTAMIRSIEGMFDSVIERGGGPHSGPCLRVWM